MGNKKRLSRKKKKQLKRSGLMNQLAYLDYMPVKRGGSFSKGDFSSINLK